MRYLIIALLAYGGYFYFNHHLYEIHQLHDSLAYARKYPDSNVSPAIDYYAGNIYYARAEYPQAQEAFAQLLTDYPTAQYVPTALVRLEDSAENNKDWDTARTAAGKYIDDYPGGEETNLMRQRLEMVNYHHGTGGQ